MILDRTRRGLLRQGRRSVILAAASALIIGMVAAPVTLACPLGYFEFQTPQDTPLVVGADAGMLSNYPDVVITSVDLPASGQLEYAPDGSFTYTPNPGFTGDDTFTFWADLTGSSTDGIVAIRVNPPAKAADLEVLAWQKATLDIDVLGASTGGNLSIVSVTDPEHGTAVISTGVVSASTASVKPNCISQPVVQYTPDADYLGPDTFDYTITDGSTESTGTISVTVGEDSTAPTVSAPSLRLDGTPTDDGVPVKVWWQGADDESGIASYTLQSSPDGATWSDAATGANSYAKLVLDPALAKAGLTFRVIATDRSGNSATGASTDWRLALADGTAGATTHSTGWRTVRASTAFHDNYVQARTKGAWISKRTISGAVQVAIVAPTNPVYGKIRVFVDGHAVATVDLGVTRRASHVVKTIKLTGAGRHTVKLVTVSGQPTPFDAMVVLARN
jgi:hypothetical protein